MQSNFPQINLGAYNDEYASLEHIMSSYLLNQLHTVIPVKIVQKSNGLVNVKPLIKLKNITGEVIESDAVICNIPVMQIMGSNFKIAIEPSVGDKGLLFACMNDMTDYKQKHNDSVVTNNRHYNFSDGVFLPLDFTGSTTGIEVSYGDANLKIQENNITINCSNATVNATSINLGGEAGLGVARIGDSVDLNTGKITSGSAVVKAL